MGRFWTLRRRGPVVAVKAEARDYVVGGKSGSDERGGLHALDVDLFVLVALLRSFRKY
jgi:hypothetical protein